MFELKRLRRRFATTLAVFVFAATVSEFLSAASAFGATCPQNDSALALAPGFCATVFADGIGHARHLVVAPNGVVYVNTWSGRYYGKDPARSDGFVVALQDTKGTGRADAVERFGPTKATGAAGGTGIGIFRGALYVELNDRIERYPLPASGRVPTEKPTTVVKGLPLDGDHPMHPFAIDADGALYVDLGSASNACQRQNRAANSPGVNPCTELKTRGGIWRYDATKADQKFSPAERYATGIRNAVGIAIDPKGNAVYATQHGRDQLSGNWAKLYTDEQSAKLPAEELLKIERGADYGWPTCYFDAEQNKLVLAPEYGGDGGRSVGPCAGKVAPVAAFPAHWAPNALVMSNARADDGAQSHAWPDRYRDGAFIAFHGSWNRAPFAQGGYNVVFQSLASDHCEIFADGFAGANVSPGGAAHRPSGLAFGPDGALYVADDQRGRIYRITYVGGDVSAAPTACPGASAGAVAAATPAAGSADATPGRALYQSSGCAGCHGDDGHGSPLGPNLSDREWLWGDGSEASIAKTIRDGVPNPKQYRDPMPPLGGAQLSDAQLAELAAYVHAISHTSTSQIQIPGDKVFPESLTSTHDGTIYIGSIAQHQVFRVPAGTHVAQPWVTVDPAGPQMVFGVFADDATGTVWTCVNSFDDGAPPAELQALDVRSAKTTARYPMPGAHAFCNDVAVGRDGTVYATDTNNMEVVRLKKGATALESWTHRGAFGPAGGVLDGIAVIGDAIYVNTLHTNKLFRVPIDHDGKPGSIKALALSRPIDAPDGMRTDAKRLLLIESGGPGRLSRVDLDGNNATVTTLKEGFPDGATAVTRVGDVAWVLEAQLKAMNPSANDPVHPFRATAVPAH
jgi:glucose/arabinose dehydrogenase/cytochrome c553